MTRQEVFNTIMRELWKQGRIAVNEGGRCYYRTGDGRKCAFGVLIPDELYLPIYEGDPVANIAIDLYHRTYDPKFNFYAQEHIFLRALQECHDSQIHGSNHTWNDDYDTFTRAFGEFAAQYDLNFPTQEELNK